MHELWHGLLPVISNGLTGLVALAFAGGAAAIREWFARRGVSAAVLEAEREGLERKLSGAQKKALALDKVGKLNRAVRPGKRADALVERAAKRLPKKPPAEAG
jgi:hypothetical protein